MIRMNRILSILLLMPFMSSANVQIYPVRLDLKESEPTGAFTIVNNNSDTNEPGVSMNAILVVWDQDNGQNVYSKNPDELFLIPPIFTIPPDSRQIIRISLIKPPDPDIEKAYRVLFKQFSPEIVSMSLNQSKTLINFAIRTDISVPVFISPLAPKKISVLFSANYNAATNTILLKIKNLGNTHIHLINTQLKNSEKLLGESKEVMYILPGSTMSEKIKVTQPISAGSIIKAKLTTDDVSYPELMGDVDFQDS